MSIQAIPAGCEEPGGRSDVSYSAGIPLTLRPAGCQTPSPGRLGDVKAASGAGAANGEEAMGGSPVPPGMPAAEPVVGAAIPGLVLLVGVVVVVVGPTVVVVDGPAEVTPDAKVLGAPTVPGVPFVVARGVEERPADPDEQPASVAARTTRDVNRLTAAGSILHLEGDPASENVRIGAAFVNYSCCEHGPIGLLHLPPSLVGDAHLGSIGI